jgi:hypothetical protein
MLICKLFEILDEGTRRLVMATAMNPIPAAQIRYTAPFLHAQLCRERALLADAGFADQRPATAYPPGPTYVRLGDLRKGFCTYNASNWRDGSDGCPRSATMYAAHCFIIEHWSELRSGETIDVEKLRIELTECGHPRTTNH